MQRPPQTGLGFAYHDWFIVCPCSRPPRLVQSSLTTVERDPRTPGFVFVIVILLTTLPSVSRSLAKPKNGPYSLLPRGALSQLLYQSLHHRESPFTPNNG